LSPERRDRPINGRIEPLVTILNGAGILVGVVLGVIAFAVDFITGTIYLTNKKIALLLNTGDIRVLKLEAGVGVNFDSDQVFLQKLELQTQVVGA